MIPENITTPIFALSILIALIALIFSYSSKKETHAKTFIRIITLLCGTLIILYSNQTVGFLLIVGSILPNKNQLEKINKIVEALK